MKKFGLTLSSLAVMAFFLSGPQLKAATLAQNLGGSQSSVLEFFWGQSFTVGGSGSYDDVALNLYDSAGAPYALGTGFLLTSAYAGTPSALSSATAGYVGSTDASGNFYTFSPSLTLAAGTTYYFYENAALGSITGDNTYGSNAFYDSSAANSGYLSGAPSSINFTVTGDQIAATPEPSSLLLLGTGALSLCGVIRRKLAAK
jgi:hypothetical protein